MKKIIMRMAMSPFDNCDLYKVVSQDTIGTNAGNMLFPYSIMRNIYDEDVIIDSYRSPNEKDAEEINKNYDMFLIPLANAFRESFITELNNLTRLIKKLTIPCVVVGVGLQTAYEPRLHMGGYSFDEEVSSFVKAVLDKSTSLGVRGQITADYLKKLGFDEKYIDVIGCPSMFLYGDFLPLKKPFTLTEQSVLTMNYHGNYENYFRFLERCKQEYPNYYIVLQGIRDLRLLYAGDSISDEFKVSSLYIRDTDNRSYINNRLRMFINVNSWIDFLSRADIGIGSCIHGSIASILAGNPTLVFPADSRVRELAEYHNIPRFKMTDIDERTRLLDLYERIDFSMIQQGHKDRYKQFVNFLCKNGIEPKQVGYKSNVFDRKMQSITLNEPKGVGCYTALSYEEQRNRLNLYLHMVEGKIKWWEKHGNGEKNIKQWEESRKCIADRIERLK